MCTAIAGVAHKQEIVNISRSSILSEAWRETTQGIHRLTLAPGPLSRFDLVDSAQESLSAGFLLGSKDSLQILKTTAVSDQFSLLRFNPLYVACVIQDGT